MHFYFIHCFCFCESSFTFLLIENTSRSHHSDPTAKNDTGQNSTFLQCLRLVLRVQILLYCCPYLFQALPGFLEQRKVGSVVAVSTIERHRDTQHHDPASDTCPWYRYNLPPSQSPPVSLCQHGLQPGTTLAKVPPQPFSSLRLFLSYFWLVSSFLWRRLSHSPSQYLTLQGFSRPSQQVSSKSLFAHSL